MQKNISISELILLLMSIKKMTEVEVLYHSIVRVRKSYIRGEVSKRARIRGVIGIDYASFVNSQRSREGKDRNFQPLKRSWGERVKGSTCLIENTESNSFYLDIIVQEVITSKYYFNNSMELDAEDVESNLIKSSSESHQQGLLNEVVSRSIKLTNIIEIKINNITYIINQ